jgi:hypothetical protein
MHDECREEGIDAGYKVSTRHGESLEDISHEGGCKAELVVLRQCLDDRGDHAGCLVGDVLGRISHVFREAV